ncbi:sulfite exporter TauE/SafE family protein [Nitrosomonas sp.]|uniref:sulfite exporter TauE/SafE family protein n=1 Tax=Nitrosomonas sp. TaxID=42353 RepID=UPI0025F0B2CA|nr:sulfite exporter TauE/SafE family protein [Nitrosomonas sp.]MCC6916945.1 sulfite exporter TauE/SafE family protein [Nitrosomonas sp.]
MEAWPIYLLTGGIVGFLAGLLGIGGGLLMVPVLAAIFASLGFPSDRILHSALGTTTAIITLTAVASLRAHHSRGAVNWRIVRYITPGIIAGALTGSTLAGQLSSRVLGMIFVLFIYLAATQMWLNLKPGAGHVLPGKTGLFVAGGVIGALSSLVAIGGGLLTVPFLTACQIRVHHAIGTAAAIGFPVALASAAGYAINGLLQTQPLPDYSLGYIYLPALVMVAMTSTVTAPFGAKTAHILPAATLRKIFAGLLYLLGTRLLLDFQG